MRSVDNTVKTNWNKLTEHDGCATEKLKPREPLRTDVVGEHFDHVDVCQGIVANAVS